MKTTAAQQENFKTAFRYAREAIVRAECHGQLVILDRIQMGKAGIISAKQILVNLDAMTVDRNAERIAGAKFCVENMIATMDIRRLG